MTQTSDKSALLDGVQIEIMRKDLKLIYAGEAMVPLIDSLCDMALSARSHVEPINVPVAQTVERGPVVTATFQPTPEVAGSSPAGDAPSTGAEPSREGFYEKLWKDFVSIQRGDAVGICEKVERYYREQAAPSSTRTPELSMLEQEGLLESILTVVAPDMRVAAKTDIQRLMVASHNDGMRAAPSATAATSDWNAAIEKALLACEAEQAKYSYAGGAAQAVRGALEYAMFAIRGLRRQSAFHPYCAKCEKPAPSSGGCSQADCGIRRTDGGAANG